MLSWPMIAFGWVTNMLQRGMASWKRMLEVLDARAGDQRRRTSTDAGRAAAARRRDRVPRPDVHVSRRRPAGARSTSSLRIEAGQTVALVGATGSGKSTLISLLPRLHEPPPGTVFIDGVDVREIPLARAARRDRLRAAGAVPVLRHDRRQRRVRRRCAATGRRTAAARASAIARTQRPRSRGSTRTSPTSRTATTRWSASAASRCRAARSSAPRSRARS